MSLWSDLGRKWALEPESKHEIEGNICIIKICPIKWFDALTPTDNNTLFPLVQSVQFD